MTKQCSKTKLGCGKKKSFSEFYRRTGGKINTPGGYRYICKSCDDRNVNKKRKENGYYTEAEKKRSKTKKYKERSKIASRKNRIELTDMYIRSLMTKKFKGLNPKDIPEELVKAHRQNLLIKRALGLTPKLKEGD